MKSPPCNGAAIVSRAQGALVAKLGLPLLHCESPRHLEGLIERMSEFDCTETTLALSTRIDRSDHWQVPGT